MTFIEVYQEYSIWNMTFSLYNNELGKGCYHPIVQMRKTETYSGQYYHVAEPVFELRTCDSAVLAFSHCARLSTYLH